MEREKKVAEQDCPKTPGGLKAVSPAPMGGIVVPEGGYSKAEAVRMKNSLRARLEKFYQIHAPHKQGGIPKVVAYYWNRSGDLLNERLRAQYGHGLPPAPPLLAPPPPTGEPPATPR